MSFQKLHTSRTPEKLEMCIILQLDVIGMGRWYCVLKGHWKGLETGLGATKGEANGNYSPLISRLMLPQYLLNIFLRNEFSPALVKLSIPHNA